jgi:hypothetical protein
MQFTHGVKFCCVVLIVSVVGEWLGPHVGGVGTANHGTSADNAVHARRFCCCVVFFLLIPRQMRC